MFIMLCQCISVKSFIGTRVQHMIIYFLCCGSALLTDGYCKVIVFFLVCSILVLIVRFFVFILFFRHVHRHAGNDHVVLGVAVLRLLEVMPREPHDADASRRFSDMPKCIE